MKVVEPVTITDAVLVGSNVAENDYPAWAAGTTYAVGARVILTSTHRIYESAGAGNIGNHPAAGAAGKWIDVSATNRWAMFDQAVGSLTEAIGNITVTLAPPAAIGALAVLDTNAVSVRVKVTSGAVTIYDQTQVPSDPTDDEASMLFLDLPQVAGVQIVVTVSASGPLVPVAAGTLLLGNVLDLGLTEAGPSVGIDDFSRRETDDFGLTTVVERGWAKRMTIRSLIETGTADEVQRRLAALRAKPALWIGEEGFESLAIYGFFKDFAVDLALETVSFCSLTIEGLTTAGALEPNPYTRALAEIEARLGQLDQAQEDASEALDDLAEIFSDGKLTPAEKIQKLIPGDAELEASWAILDAQAGAIAGSAAVAAARTTAATARGNWQAYRNTLNPAWNDTSDTTPVVRGTFNTKLGDYRTGITVLIDALRAYAQTRSNWSGTSNDNGQMPANNAGTSRTLTPIGAYTTVQGNSQVKAGGTHGLYQGGTVSSALVGTAFVSSSLLAIQDGTAGGWCTSLALDSSATNFVGAFGGAAINVKYEAVFVANTPTTGMIYLYGSGGAGLIASAAVTGLTPASRMALVYDGTSIFVLLDGGKYVTTAVASGQTLWPKVLDFYQSGAPGWAIKDIQSGPWTDQSQAKAAQADASSGLAQIADIQSDSVLSRVEKPEIIRRWNAIIGEANLIGASANALIVDTTAYSAAYNALGTYFAGLNPSYSDTTQDTTIVPATFNQRFKDYYDARQALLNAIDLKASQVATWSGVTGTGRPSDGATTDQQLDGVGPISLVGNSLTRTSGSGDYEAYAFSKQPLQGAQLAAVDVHPTLWTMVALTKAITSSNHYYTDMTVEAQYNYAGQGLSIYVSGSLGYSVNVGSVAGKLEVLFDGKRFTVRLGGIVRWQSKLLVGAATWSLYGAFHAYNSGSPYTGLTHRSMTAPVAGTATLFDARNESVVGSGGSVWEISGGTAIYRSASQWIGNAYSLESQTGTAMVAARFTDTGSNMIGLADNRQYGGANDYVYGQYLVYSSGGDLYAYESGTGISLGVTHTNASPAVVVITYDGVNVRYYVNGVEKRVVATTAGRTFYVCVAGGGNGQGFTDVQFGAYSQNDWGSTGGANRPADNATVGGTLGTNIRDSGSVLLNDGDVRNNVDSVIRAPGGAVFTTQASVVNGSLKVRLPQSWTSTMMRFTVEIYEYSSGFMCTLEVGGYNYSGSSWLNTSARVLGGSNVEYPVYFGHDGTCCCVWIGTAAETWSYPQVRVRDFFAGYSGFTRALWESGWQLSFSTGGPINVTSTITDTLPGADWAKIPSRSGRPEDNADVTLTSQFTSDIEKSVEIAFDYTGTTASGVPKIMPVTVTRGGTNVTLNSQASYSVGNFTGGCTNANITVDNTTGSTTKGRPTIVSGAAAPGTFDWIVSYNGVQVAKVTVQVSKKLAAAPAGSGSGSSGFSKNGTFDAGGASLSTTSYAEIGRVSNLVKATGESIYASFYGMYHASGSGNFVSRYGVVKLQYSVAGANSWTDFGPTVQGGTATFSNLSGDDNPGDVTIYQSVAPANGNYDVRAVGVINSTLQGAVLTFETPAPGSVIVKV
ncbi:hypothetical protein HZY97_20155 [Sphingomonas sp. R-74633]|uniref:hypothetical protein n=1 Tax=Sphingomonas sp. R-74633 TaxID=2751188 RepID=UPI0015D2735F|nr:hypothetical protein [Sphingomonas sp. R-74633]NYT43099.1 hypothetical protein [Sphingomonas sp. R-74633]